MNYVETQSRVAGALDEFSTARAASAMPACEMRGKNVLDVGCADGKYLADPVYANAAERWGIDPDENAIEMGRKLFPEISLVRGYAEQLPFPDAHFDVIISRVALPFADIPKAFREMARVIKPHGHVYLYLHDWRLHLEFTREAVKALAWKRVIDLSYVTLAGAIYAAFGFIPRKPWGGRESFQCAFRIRKQLSRAGFEEIVHGKRGRHFVVKARRRAD